MLAWRIGPARPGIASVRGPRGSARERQIAPAILLSVLLIIPFKVHALTIGGRSGLEVDGSGESYQSGGLFDDRLFPSDGIEEALEDQPVRTRDVTLLGLLELELEQGSRERAWLRASDAARWGATRRRNTLEVEMGLKAGDNRLRLEHEWEAQGGEDEPASGSQALLTAIYDREFLPGLRAQVRAGADWSRPEGDTLVSLFDYRILRAQAELQKSFEPRSDLRLRGQASFRRKESFGSGSGSYSSRSAEIEAGGIPRPGDRLELLLRLEGRDYIDRESGIPSSIERAVQARYELRERAAARPYLEQRIEWQDYDRSSGIFQDSRSWGGEIGIDLLAGRFGGRAARGGRDSGPEWRTRLAVSFDLQTPDDDSSDSLSAGADYGEYGGILGIVREGGERFWLDLSIGAGRRDYARGGGTTLAFEGLNFSLATTDYDYVRASLIAQWTPIARIEQEIFVQWDEEVHDAKEDDFRLWIVSYSIARRF